jgi:SAM-dependent methyltransferase
MNDLPAPAQQLLGYYATTVLAVGRASGALEALLAGPATAAELAERSGLDERNLRLWLRALAASGNATRHGDSYAISEPLAMFLSPAFPSDLRAVLDFVHAKFAPSVHAATAAMRTGHGVAWDEWADDIDIMGRINTPTYRAALIEEWIAAAPGLGERLGRGGRIADIACGNGDAATLMAEAFPAATVVGHDPGAPESSARPNVTFSRETTLAGSSYDLITCLDALHHLGDPDTAVQAAYDALVPGGVYIVAETNLTGDPEADDQDPFSLIAHTAGLLYCLQDNLAAGGRGETPSDGLVWVEEALEAAGFRTESIASETGYRVFVATKPG